MLNKLLNLVHKKDGYLHWLTQRISALVALILLTSVFFIKPNIFFLLLLVILCFHLCVGIQTLLDDYVHNHILHLTGVFFLRLMVIFSVKSIFILFI